jgi:hypothetical protein
MLFNLDFVRQRKIQVTPEMANDRSAQLTTKPVSDDQI